MYAGRNPISAVEQAFFLLKAARRWIWRRSSQSWPVTDGTVENWYLNDEEDTSRYSLAYSYSVNGSFYSGEERLTSLDEDEFRHSLLNKKILVRYKPERPEISVLLHSDNPGVFEEQS